MGLNRESRRKDMLARYSLTSWAGRHWTQAFLEQLASCKDEEARGCLIRLNSVRKSGRWVAPPRPAWITRAKRTQLGAVEELAAKLFRSIDGVTHDLVYIQPRKPELLTPTQRELAIVDAEIKRLRKSA